MFVNFTSMVGADKVDKRDIERKIYEQRRRADYATRLASDRALPDRAYDSFSRDRPMKPEVLSSNRYHRDNHRSRRRHSSHREPSGREQAERFEREQGVRVMVPPGPRKSRRPRESSISRRPAEADRLAIECYDTDPVNEQQPPRDMYPAREDTPDQCEGRNDQYATEEAVHIPPLRAQPQDQYLKPDSYEDTNRSQDRVIDTDLRPASVDQVRDLEYARPRRLEEGNGEGFHGKHRERASE